MEGMTPRQEAELRNISNTRVLASFPNTVCCDGQFVDTNENVSVLETAGTHKYLLTSYLPDDGQKYEVYVHLYGSYSSDAAVSSYCTVYSDIYSQNGTSGSYAQIYVTANSRVSTSDFTIPVGLGRKIYYVISGTFGSIYMRLQGYRRIGTNE